MVNIINCLIPAAVNVLCAHGVDAQRHDEDPNKSETSVICVSIFAVAVIVALGRVYKYQKQQRREVCTWTSPITVTLYANGKLKSSGGTSHSYAICSNVCEEAQKAFDNLTSEHARFFPRTPSRDGKIIFSPYNNLSYFSSESLKTYVSEFMWGVTVITQGKTPVANVCHARLVFEGMDGGTYFVRIAEFDGGVQKPKDITSSVRKAGQITYTQRSYLYKGKRSVFEQCLKDIAEAAGKPAPANRLGAGSLGAKPGEHNCLSWALEQIGRMGFTVPKNPWASICTLAPVHPVMRDPNPLGLKQDEATKLANQL